jgi:hypothetical protein
MAFTKTTHRADGVHKNYTTEMTGHVHKNETPTKPASDTLPPGVTSIAHTASIHTSSCFRPLSVSDAH